MTPKIKVIACDFDGTLVSNAWPEIGTPNHEVIKAMIQEREIGNKVILWTCREGKMLRDAVEFCADHGLYFDAVNKNLPERIAKHGTDPRKIGADEYIDDLSSTRFRLPYIPLQGTRARFTCIDEAHALCDEALFKQTGIPKDILKGK